MDIRSELTAIAAPGSTVTRSGTDFGPGLLKNNQNLQLATAGVVALHFFLLVASLPDYRVSVDSAYHTALVEEAFSVVLSHYLDEQRGNLF